MTLVNLLQRKNFIEIVTYSTKSLCDIKNINREIRNDIFILEKLIF